MKNLPLRYRGVRLLGFSISGFNGSRKCQADLFGESVEAKQRRRDAASDRVNLRPGPTALHRAAELVRAVE